MICSNCKREPETFDLDNGEIGYWMIADKEDQDATHLMSDLSLAFRCSTEKEPKLKENEIALCVRCVEADSEDHG